MYQVPERPPKPRKTGGSKLLGCDNERKMNTCCRTDGSDESIQGNYNCKSKGNRSQMHKNCDGGNFRKSKCQCCGACMGHKQMEEESSDSDNESVQNNRPSCSHTTSPHTKDRNRSLYIDILKNNELDDSGSNSECDNGDSDDDDEDDGALHLECKWVKKRSKTTKKLRNQYDSSQNRDLRCDHKHQESFNRSDNDSDWNNDNERMNRSRTRKALRAGSENDFVPKVRHEQYSRQRDLQSDSGIDYRPRRVARRVSKKFQHIEHPSIPKDYSKHRELHREEKYKRTSHSAPHNRVAFDKTLSTPIRRRSTGHLFNYPPPIKRGRDSRAKPSSTNTHWPGLNKETKEQAYYNEACILC